MSLSVSMIQRTLVLIRKLEPGNNFGIDYAQDLMAFFDPLYTPAATFSLPSPSGPLPVILVPTRSSDLTTHMGSLSP